MVTSKDIAYNNIQDVQIKVLYMIVIFTKQLSRIHDTCEKHAISAKSYITYSSSNKIRSPKRNR